MQILSNWRHYHLLKNTEYLNAPLKSCDETDTVVDDKQEAGVNGCWMKGENIVDTEWEKWVTVAAVA